MKNLDIENVDQIFQEFALSVEEMISVKGGDGGDPLLRPAPPTIII